MGNGKSYGMPFRMLLMKKIVILLSIMACLVFIRVCISKPLRTRSVEKKIEQEFQGIVIEKMTVIENLEPTALKIAMNDNILTIYPTKEVMNAVLVGDSLIKNKNENRVDIIRNHETTSFQYTKVPDDFKKR